MEQTITNFYLIFEHVKDGVRYKQSGKGTIDAIMEEPTFESIKFWEQKMSESGLKEVVILDWKKLSQ